jgi:GTPase
MAYKSGFVTIIGRPNVGKSTLINKLAGQKIAIMSSKPQTTRNTIKAVVTDDKSQIIFIDTPGIHRPKNKLDEYMVDVAQGTLNEIDAVLFLVEAIDVRPGAGDTFIAEQLKATRSKVFLVINKIDLIEKEQLFNVITNYKELMEFEAIIPISALGNEGVGIIAQEIKKILPDGPKYFPDDMLTDQPEKAIVGEIIREKILYLVNEEVPHGVGVEIISFKEGQIKQKPGTETAGGIVRIQANIYCEKDSHKGILIGKEGKMLKRIGTLSRQEIEKLLGTKVFLELWIKVKPDWRNSGAMLKTLGYRNQ